MVLVHGQEQRETMSSCMKCDGDFSAVQRLNTSMCAIFYHFDRGLDTCFHDTVLSRQCQYALRLDRNSGDC